MGVITVLLFTAAFTLVLLAIACVIVLGLAAEKRAFVRNSRKLHLVDRENRK